MEYVAGVNTKTLPIMYYRDVDLDAEVYEEDGSEYSKSKVELKTVLVVKQAGKYKAYLGVGTEEFVRKHGVPLSYEEAILRFPFQFSKEQYIGE